MSDPGSLQNLNDIVAPAPVAWWPPAPGWYALAVLLLLLLTWWGFRGLRSWQQGRYRREALQSLKGISESGPLAAAALPDLLKRVALSAWPRDEIAGLVGPEWHRFLDHAAGSERFEGEAGRRLEQAAYAPGKLSGEDFRGLCADVDWWIRHHASPER